MLYPTRRDSQIAVVGERELPPILENGQPGSVDYYAEFIDQARMFEADYETGFHDFLRLKYTGRVFDLVIAMGDAPLAFISRYRHLLFADTPVVFFSSGRPPRRLANSTGLAVPINLSDTLALAAAMQPDIRQVFVVSGASGSDLEFEKAARAQFRAFESRFAFTYLSGLSTKDLEARLSALPSHSIIYYLLVDRDGAGEIFHPLEYLNRVTAVANAPVYCWVDSAMDRGIVGGGLKDQSAQTKAIGELAVRVLRGELADSIPISSPDLNVRQVDWRQLQRWGIIEARLPAGTLVRFREPSALDRYYPYVLGVAMLLLAQTALIAGLLVQRSRRRLAEEQLRGSQAALRTSYERIRALGARLLLAQEGERSRIARELHDDVSQQMALLSIDLEQLGAAVPVDAASLADDVLNRAQSISRSVHDLSHRLHPAKLRLIGLVAALNGLRRELSASGIDITFTHEKIPPTLPSDLTLCLFRIVQEALQNALKHSAARQVSIHLSRASEGLALTVSDNGTGFDVDAAWGKGLGLVSMSERVEAIGGTFEIRSTPGAGTRLAVKVPLCVTEDADMVAV